MDREPDRQKKQIKNWTVRKVGRYNETKRDRQTESTTTTTTTTTTTNRTLPELEACSLRFRICRVFVSGAVQIF